MRSILLFVSFLLVVTTELVAAEPPDPTLLNAAVVKFCASKAGTRVGGGECAHLVTEALRVAGAEFTQTGADGKHVPDSPTPGDYVWGRRVKTYSFDDKAKKLIDSDPKQKCIPGDVLQFRSAKMADGFSYPHHTAVVSAVDPAGNPTGVYQQNVKPLEGGDARVARKWSFLALGLTSGKIMVYRPEKPTNPAPMQMTWTNNSKAETVEFTLSGRKGSIGAANSAAGFLTLTGGKGIDKVTVNGKEYSLTTRKGYEFYSTPEGQIAMREIK